MLQRFNQIKISLGGSGIQNLKGQMVRLNSIDVSICPQIAAIAELIYASCSSFMSISVSGTQTICE